MLKKLSYIAGMAALFTGPLVLAEDVPDASSIADAVLKGTPHVNFRYRYEFVDEADFAEDANASTLRFRPARC